ncbi:MAG: hemolysin family protein [Porcipelethomonas sp.]
MDADGSQIIKIIVVILVLLILVKGFFTACECAVIESNDAKVKNLAEKEKKYKRLLELIESPSRLITSFSIGRIGMNMLIGISILLLDTFITEGMAFTTNPKYIIRTILILLAGIVVTTALTEILPKKLAKKNTEKFAAAVAVPVKIYITILSPLSLLAYGITAVICKPFGVSVSAKEEAVTEEEIRMMVDAGNETGVIEENQREMINNIFEFGDVDVSDVMTHRKDIVAIEVNSKIGDIVYLAINEGYSRIPVYEETVDNIIGIIYVKDLLCLVGCERSEDFTIRQFMRKAIYVPETCMCSDAFETLTKEKAQCAIVVDEYGGTAGLVSMEDILEEIVGNIQDEYDDEKAEIVCIDKNVYTISGDTRPEDVEEELGLVMPEEHNYDTMSAFVVDLLGRIPEEDEAPSVVYGDIEFTVLLTEDNWISKIKARKIEKVKGEAEA